MKRLALGICSLGLFLVACNDNKKTSDNTDTKTTVKSDTVVTTAPSKDTAQSAPQPVDTVAMKKAWMEYMTPGPMQAMMAKWNGTWNEEITMWMSPGAPPSKSTSRAVNKMAFNGLYQESEVKGSFEGMPFMGKSLLAYDNLRHVFQSTWIDNMGSGIMFLEGTYDSTSHTITLSGNTTDPATRKQMAVRQVMKVINDNTQQMEMYNGSGKSEFKSMEILMKRATSK
jgi:hypothetical protein